MKSSEGTGPFFRVNKFREISEPLIIFFEPIPEITHCRSLNYMATPPFRAHKAGILEFQVALVHLSRKALLCIVLYRFHVISFDFLHNRLNSVHFGNFPLFS